MRLENRVTLITGGGRGIGQSIALRLAREGANIVVAGPDQDELDASVGEIEKLGHGVLATHVDVTQEDQIRAMAERASEVSMSW